MNIPDAESAANPAPLDALFEQVYTELRTIARGKRTPGDGETLNTTALVHELYVQMSRNEQISFSEPRQFYAYAARAMRNLLIDRARVRARYRHGGDLQRVEFSDTALDGLNFSIEQAFALDQALTQLAGQDARAADVVELHYFAGLPIERIAELMHLSARTVNRDWQFARAFLYSQLGSPAS